MQNVGTPDRILRLIAGALLIAAPFLVRSALWANAWIFGGAILVGAILMATALFNFCPIYAALGLGSRRKTSS